MLGQFSSRIYIKILYFIYFFAFGSVRNSSGMYDFGRCLPERYKFKTFTNISIRECVRKCAIRPACKSVGYFRNFKTCSLHSSVSLAADGNENPYCVQVQIEDVDVSKFTGNCNCLKWEVCDVTSGQCKTDYDPDDCYRFDQATYDYQGRKNVTINGHQCQLWSSQTPHAHVNRNDYLFPEKNTTAARNYCRDPDQTGYIWCYTTNENLRWEICDVYVCRENQI